ncbi:hypothetical protein GCM10011498_23520 [Amylibacter cionae]|uniref:Uncharacterized protein n=1 Tax=Neptunicoccus cionae TaxID=2035344 RepID=A0A916QZH8_9RHOB|nr:hypothetical protein GCM10011498_23520 [Amylibacter cionae]
MIAKVRRRSISGGSTGWFEVRSNMGVRIVKLCKRGKKTALGQGELLRIASIRGRERCGEAVLTEFN